SQAHVLQILAVLYRPKARGAGRTATNHPSAMLELRGPAVAHPRLRVKASISRGSNPVRLRSKSSAFSSPNSTARASRSHSAQFTERLTISRKAFTCASVHPSQGTH